MSTPGVLSPEQQAAIAKSQKEGRAISLWTVGIFCIYCWDYVICLPKEIKYIWRKRISFVSVLYLTGRYFGLVQGAVGIWIMDITNTGPQAATCKKIFLWQPIGAFLLTLISHLIMASRVYALYTLSKMVLVVLGTIMAADVAVQIYAIPTAFPAPPPSPNVSIPCIAIGDTQLLIAFWAVPLAFDTVTFLLTAYKTYTFWKQEMHTPTITLIFRDGLIYFAAIFSMNLVNVILFTTQDSGLKSINLPATIRLNIMMACRLVLNLRKPHARINMTGPSVSTTREERRPHIWPAEMKPDNNTYELSSNAQKSIGVTVLTETDTRV